MEAMELGIPVVATDVGSISEHVLNNWNGFVGPNDPFAFMNFAIDCINKISNDKVLYSSLVNNARKYAEDRFNMEKFNSNYRSLFYE